VAIPNLGELKLIIRSTGRYKTRACIKTMWLVVLSASPTTFTLEVNMTKYILFIIAQLLLIAMGIVEIFRGDVEWGLFIIIINAVFVTVNIKGLRDYINW
jgi:hypothetical protein